MKLNRQEKEIVRRKFCAYCIKVLRGEALNYLDELERQRKREVNFSEILQSDKLPDKCTVQICKCHGNSQNRRQNIQQ